MQAILVAVQEFEEIYHSCIGLETNCWPLEPWHNEKKKFQLKFDQASWAPANLTTCHKYLSAQGEHIN